MAITDDSKILEMITELKRKPGHEKVRVVLHDLLVNGLNIDLTAIHLEENLKEIRGRMDALLGRTIIEIKTDLDREINDAKEQLLRYIKEKESGGDSYVGIATDGSIFKVFVRENDELELIGEYVPDINKPREILLWLESVLVLQDKLLPEAITIEMELGRESIFYNRSLRIIKELWEELQRQDDTESATKYKEWSRLLDIAYLEEVEKHDLFIQHTYLTFVAKAISTIALLKKLPNDAESFLSGKGFESANIDGAIESDFFDWVLLHKKTGENLIMDIARQVQKFDWGELEADILKVLYENLIDPDQRRTLGEYYTPDWLAEKICREVITKPLDMRIIDPTCGSGTFLFHAIRLGIQDAEKSGVSKDDAVQKLTENIAGIDVHPVAVIFARATYLLALLPLFQGKDAAKGNFSVLVYLGNSLQWDVEKDASNKTDLEIVVPAVAHANENKNGENKHDRIMLRFPTDIAKKKKLFDDILKQMMNLSEEMINSSDQEKFTETFSRFLESHNEILKDDIKALVKTFKSICILKTQKRNHIWGYVARNLARPLWLSSEEQKADIIIGNPPWQSYGKMGKAKDKFMVQMKRMELWSNKASAAPSHDLSCYCFAKFIELYMKKNGKIAFVMPLATLTRQYSEKFRVGRFLDENFSPRYFKFTEAWGLPSDLQPLFPVPACVLFGKNAGKPYAVSPPNQMKYIRGKLYRRNATLDEAKKALNESTEPWPTDEELRSEYGKKFQSGACFSPVRLVFVERVSGGIRENLSSPMVQGKAGKLDKKPWDKVTVPSGNVEEEFLYKIYKGLSIAPYRIITQEEGVVPWDKKHLRVMDKHIALRSGFSNLYDWLGQVEKKWESGRSRNVSFADQIDHFNKLSRQFPIAPIRVVYAASGTWPAATIIKDKEGLIDTKLYWTEPRNLEEAYYLIAILNSETTRAAAAQWQSEGLFGKRDFSRSMFNLSIPLFDDKIKLHKTIADSAKQAEKIASHLQPNEGEDFKKFRKRIRNALIEDGLAGEIDKLVAKLLKLKI